MSYDWQILANFVGLFYW